MDKFVSESVDLSNLKADEFNLIVSGCGTGKTRFVTHGLLDALDAEPEDIVFITSRRAIADQLDCNGEMTRFTDGPKELVRHWNEDIEVSEECKRKGVHVFTYSQFITFLKDYGATGGCDFMERVKAIVIDECHALVADGHFVDDSGLLQLMLNTLIRFTPTMVIGLTATPKPLFSFNYWFPFKFNLLLEKPLVRYKAKKMWLVKEEHLDLLLRDKETFAGKTLMMGRTRKQCLELAESLGNAACIFAKQYKGAGEAKLGMSPAAYSSMLALRDEIIATETIPDTFVVDGKNEIKIDTLISTTTLREGINLREECGVRNIICCHQDEMTIIQFLGRCRFNVDNLIIVNDKRPFSPRDLRFGYFGMQDQSFNAFISEGNEVWLQQFADVVEHADGEDVKIHIYGNEKPCQEFYEWLDGKYADTDEDVIVYKDEDRKEIARKAFNARLLSDLAVDGYTFIAVCKHLTATGRYEILDKKVYIDKKQQRVKIIRRLRNGTPTESKEDFACKE